MSNPTIISGPNPDQIEKAAKLQTLLLDNFLELAESGELTAADRKTLVQLLQSNGWSLDPANVPQNLLNKLTKGIDPKDLADEHPHLRRLK